MATHSCILAWRIPRTESLVGYSSWGRKESDTTVWLTHIHLKRKGFSGSKSPKEAACQSRRHVRKMPWRSKGQPTPVFLPEESHGQRSLAGYVHRVGKGQTRLKRLSTRLKRMDKHSTGTPQLPESIHPGSSLAGHVWNWGKYGGQLETLGCQSEHMRPLG